MMKTTKVSKKKFLAGLSVSLVLAMAIGSFAMGETTVSHHMYTTIEATNDEDTGDFAVDNMTGCSFSDGVLTIGAGAFPTISMKSGVTSTTQRIEVTGESTITLNGVNIDRSNNTDLLAALTIVDDATFGVDIMLADNSTNILKGETGSLEPSRNGSPGIQKINKRDEGDANISNFGELNIGGSSGKLEATGGICSAGIGSCFNGNEFLDGNYITISGGKITSIGGRLGAGIGGGLAGNGSHINITGGTVEAYGGGGGAGIGGGGMGIGSNIEIAGGKITAIGGFAEDDYMKYIGSGIGSGYMVGATNNKLNGDAVVFAASGGEDSTTGKIKDALEGFDQASGGSIDRGIAFTGVGTEFDSDGKATKINWEKGELYGDSVKITEDATLPTDFTITSNAAVTVDEGVTLAMEEGKNLKVQGLLKNDGSIAIPDKNLLCDGEGKVETLLNYDPQGGSIKENEDSYKTYQDASGIKTYETLPEAEKDGYTFDGWYTEKEGKGAKIEESSNVLLNVHVLYAKWTTEPGPQPGPEPTPTPTPEPTPDPSVNPDGDGSGSGASSKTSDPFMGGVALALLGVATTGAILTRKLR